MTVIAERTTPGPWQRQEAQRRDGQRRDVIGRDGQRRDGLGQEVLGQEVLGRESEVGELLGLVDGLFERGSALVLRGAPGTGRTTLLDLVSGYARQSGVRTLRISGEPSAAGTPWEGLHRLLRPIMDGATRLPAPQRMALRSALGAGPGTAVPYEVATAVLELLSAAGADAPLLLMVDDAEWVDPSTRSALSLMTRHLKGGSIGLLVAVGSGSPSVFHRAGAREIELGPLPDRAAAQLLDRSDPDAGPGERERRLREAGGNPLALLEFPHGHRTRIGPAESAPMTARLARALTGQLIGLPERTRALLVLLAADAEATMPELLAAGALFAGRAVGVADLFPALDRHLVEIESGRPRFAQPLLRWAVYEDVPLTERYRAHAAFVSALTQLGRPGGRRVWHRAATVTGPDESLAQDLDAAAVAARRGGAIARAARAHELAAELSQDERASARRRVEAADLTAQLGHRDEALRLAGRAERLPLAALDRERVRLLRLGQQTSGLTTALALEAVRLAHADGAPEASSLLAVVEPLRWISPSPPAREALLAAAASLPRPERIALRALASPTEHAGALTGYLTHPDGSEDAASPGDRSLLLGTAAAAVGQFALAVPLLTEAEFQLREQGRRALLADALAQRAWAHLQLEQWPAALDDAQQAVDLARATGRSLSAASAELVVAAVRGLRGETDVALAIVARVEQALPPHEGNLVLAQAQTARGTALLAAGQYPAALDTFLRLFAADDPARHDLAGTWRFGDLADAAVRARRAPEAVGLLTLVETVATRTGSPRSRSALIQARPVLAPDTRAEDLFREALAGGSASSPFFRARLHLAHGEWLRQVRRSSEARHPLEAARSLFTSLELPVWAERAQRQLRGSGVAGSGPPPAEPVDLTYAELQVAQLAASGKSNRQIAQELFISHRTVSSHLYRIYPKLGIATRAQLHEVLSRGPEPVTRGGRIGA